MPVDLDRLKAKLSDVAGLNSLSVTDIAGRRVYGFNGVIAAVDPKADEAETERAIRKAAAMAWPTKRPHLNSFDGLAATPLVPIPTSDKRIPAGTIIATPMPPVSIQPASPKPMTTPAPGSFSASLKALLDEARAGVEQARTDGRARVGEAIAKLNDAKVATTKVAATMAQTIEDEAASALSDLGQISNSLGD